MGKSKYRRHCGSLDDSMATVVEFNNLDELVSIINDDGWAPSKIEIRPYGYDARIDWDTHLVTVGGQPVGFTDGVVI